MTTTTTMLTPEERCQRCEAAISEMIDLGLHIKVWAHVLDDGVPDLEGIDVKDAAVLALKQTADRIMVRCHRVLDVIERGIDIDPLDD